MKITNICEKVSVTFLAVIISGMVIGLFSPSTVFAICGRKSCVVPDDWSPPERGSTPPETPQPKRNPAYDAINRGNALYNQGRYAEAEDAYREATRLNPYSARAHYWLGFSLYKQGRYAEAGEVFRRTAQLDIDVNPYYADAYYALGGTLYEQGLYADAEFALREAIRTNKLNTAQTANAYNTLGAALDEQGNYAKAIEAFEEALRIDPSNSYAKENLEKTKSWLAKEQKRIAEQQKETKFSTQIREGIERLSAELSKQSPVTLFDTGKGNGSSANTLSFMETSLSSPVTLFEKSYEGSTVVDLRDAKTLTVDPSKVKGGNEQLPKKDKSSTTSRKSIDRTVVPTPAEKAAELRKQASAREHQERLRKYMALIQDPKFVNEMREARERYGKGYTRKDELISEAMHEAIKAKVEEDIKAAKDKERLEQLRSEAALDDLRKDTYRQAVEMQEFRKWLQEGDNMKKYLKSIEDLIVEGITQGD